MCLGIPGRILEIRNDESPPMGIVDFGGARRDVCLAYVADEARVGDYVIVHVGFAISMVDAAEAQRTFRLLEELGETAGLREEPSASPPASGKSGPGSGRSSGPVP